MGNRAYCLYRVSTAKQVDHDENNQAAIPLQQKACREFARKMGWNIIHEEYETGVSGFKVSAEDRDAIQTIKADAEKGLFDILLVFMFDRLGRRSAETPFVVEWFAQHGIHVWSVKEGEQRFNDHVDFLTNYIRFWQADGESKKTSVRTKTALGQMVQEGRFRGGIAPYGYDLAPSGIFNKKKHEVKKLVVNEEEAKVVKLIFNLCVGSGYGRWRIATYLNEQGIPTRSGKPWFEATISHMLHNIMYLGIIRSGESQSGIIPELQIIDEETFNFAQQLMEERKIEHNLDRHLPLNTKGQSLLSGNVFCGTCGGRLILTTNGKGYTRKDGTVNSNKRVRYVCYNKTRHRLECDGQTGYSQNILEKQITDLLHNLFSKMKAADPEEILARSQKKVRADLDDKLCRAKRECEIATEEYEKIKADVKKAIMTNSAMLDTLSDIASDARAKMIAANDNLIAVNKEVSESKKAVSNTISEYNRILGWADMFDECDIETKKMIISMLIKRIDVFKGYELKIEFNFDISQFDLGL